MKSRVEYLCSAEIPNISERIRGRLEKQQVSYKANDCIAEYVSLEELELLQKELEVKFTQLLDTLLIDHTKDPNTRGTPKRLAKMYMKEVFVGRYSTAPQVVGFPNTHNLDEVYTIGPITIRSACSHHFVPIFGEAWVGVYPGEQVIGLSKFNRLVDWICRRPQIQEDMSVQIADELEARCNPKGVAVVVRAQHMCVNWRGVEDISKMTTSVMRGRFRDQPDMKVEFLSLIAAQGFQ